MDKLTWLLSVSVGIYIGVMIDWVSTRKTLFLFALAALRENPYELGLFSGI